MITLKEMLIEEERNLRAILQKAQARLAEEVDGSLEIMHNKGSIQYRHLRRNPQTGKRERVYLAKGDPMVKRLAQWHYNKKIYGYLKAKLKDMQRLSAGYSDEAVYEFYENLPEERRVLIEPLVKSPRQRLKEWSELPYQGKGFRSGDVAIMTGRQERVRSKSEKILADLFAGYGLFYKYECPLVLNDKTVLHPDFTFFNPKKGHEIYWEHQGMMDDMAYADYARKREQKYEENGIFRGERLIITHETSHQILSDSWAKTLIERYLL